MRRLLLALVLLVAGCAPPSRLALVATAYEGEAAGLAADVDALERDYRTAGALAVDACEIHSTDCARAALAPVRARYAGRSAALDRLATLVARMRGALDVAKKCRAARDTDCERANVRAAERVFAQLHFDRVEFEERR